MSFHAHSAVNRRIGFGLIGLFVVLGGASNVRALDAVTGDRAAQDELWRKSLSLVEKGDFAAAADAVKQIGHGGSLADNLRGWLEEYQTKAAARRQMDQADMEKYIGYAKARIERKEYDKALDKALLAHDVAPDQDAFLKSDWLQQLVNDALSQADKRREDHDWRGAWDLYWRLAALFEREPRYQKLEKEMVTHIRLEEMFKEGYNWKEHIEQVRWDDAEQALECVEFYYHNLEPDHFKRMTEAGLEQVLLLAESKAAQEQFEGLRDPFHRSDFSSRTKVKLDQIRSAAAVDRNEAVACFRRVLDINDQTVRLPRELLVSELMRGALDPLDEFTSIIWPQDTDEFEKHTRGDFVGVGISIVKNRQSDEIEVVTPLEDTPACRAGVQAGDVILKVDGEPLKGYSINRVVDRITGPKDSMVTLTIRRNGTEIDFPLVRDRIKILSVKGVKRKESSPDQWDYWLDEPRGIGYVRVTNFQANTVEDLGNVLSQLEAKGLRGLVLDLRSNPGGLLDAAWKMSSLFLKQNEKVVSTRGRIRSENQQFSAEGNGAYSNVPLVLLVDENSASASEIVAGSIRDNRRGVVVGGRTFGKFSVQNLIPLGRSNAKLKLTTADYYLPSGVSLHRKLTSENWGVQPNVPVRLVRKERMNIFQGWRSAERVGPSAPKPETEQLGGDEPDAPAVDSKDEKPDAEIAEKPKEDPLPPLDQPDENDRPKDVDPQLDTALLILRSALLGATHPTLATAEPSGPRTTAQP